MSNIRLNQIKSDLNNAIDKGILPIEYSKAKCFSEAFEKEAKINNSSKVEVKDFEVKGLMSKVRGKCSISSKDFEIIEKIIMGTN